MISKTELASKIDNTILKPGIEIEEYESFITNSKNFGFNSICIPPAFISMAKGILSKNDKIATVIGFPLGYNSTAVKVFEAAKAIEDGADYIDTVINVSILKSKDFAKNAYNKLYEELSEIRKVTLGHELRIIIETCYLNETDIKNIVELIIKTNCDVVKTSTGFGPKGASVETVSLIKSITGDSIKIKASGGIKTLGDCISLINAGADIIGTSSGLDIIKKLS